MYIASMIKSAELIDRLASHDVVARRAAADELYGLGTTAVPPMIEALRCRWVEPSPQYALLCDTLARLGRVAFAPVRDALAGARTEGERTTFARVFSDLGESALPDFIDALQDPRREIRLGAIRGIARLREAGCQAAPTIAAMLGGADQRIDKAAAHALISIGPAVVPMLQEIRAAGPGRARRAALYCLAEIGGEAVLSSRDRRALERLIRIKLTHDHPMPIDCCFLIWIAVEASDQQRVMELFGLTPVWPATFRLGIAAADLDGHGPREDSTHLARVFVAPPLDGWTLLFGPWCSPLRNDALELCVRASSVFGKAQAYWYADQNDGSAWLIAENGTLIRRGANFGNARDDELALGTPLPEEAEALAAVEDEDERGCALFDFAPKLAGRLSINPLELSADTPRQGHGWLALTPIGVTRGPPSGALEF
jgi:HEAT repeat protein